MSGRDVELRVYVENHHADKCGHAIESLKHSMKWDEETYGREYDLDLYMICLLYTSPSPRDRG